MSREGWPRISEYPVTRWEPAHKGPWYGPLPAFDSQYTKDYTKTELGGKRRTQTNVRLFIRRKLFRKGGRPGMASAWIDLFKRRKK
jgi:hypothetical protein